MPIPQTTLAEAQAFAATARRPEWIDDLEELVGKEFVSTSFPDRLAAARDRWPVANFSFREGRLPRGLPSAVVRPGTAEEVRAIVAVANRHRVAVVPYGAGSGVLGGAIPLGGELCVDLKRLNRILEIDSFNGTVTVEAGINGGVLEAALRKHGLTTGHYPQSLNMSTVGGWAACRGAGQASSRYGKIEDIVLGLSVVLPTGERLVVRPVPRRAVGPSLADLFVGSEGTLGIITSVTLRVWSRPEAEFGSVLVFPNHEAGLDALRRIMQAELRPAIARLYDAVESAERARGAAGFTPGQAVCFFVFSGLTKLAEIERQLALEICADVGGREIDRRPLDRWLSERFQSYSAGHVSAGSFMDTIEIAAPWRALPEMHRRISAAVKALHSEMHFGTHWSHIYPDGACQYMTLRFPAMPFEDASRLHHRMWEEVMRLCLDLGGSVSHHHGSGLFRNDWLVEELNEGHRLLQKLKDAIDPNHLMNPGKLALQ